VNTTTTCLTTSEIMLTKQMHGKPPSQIPSATSRASKMTMIIGRFYPPHHPLYSISFWDRKQAKHAPFGESSRSIRMELSNILAGGSIPSFLIIYRSHYQQMPNRYATPPLSQHFDHTYLVLDRGASHSQSILCLVRGLAAMFRHPPLQSIIPRSPPLRFGDC
jgi:hypothetical protein